MSLLQRVKQQFIAEASTWAKVGTSLLCPRSITALDELAFRRRGLGVSLIFILAVAVGLALKIREISRYPSP